MAIIGAFKKNGEVFAGAIRTLTVNIASVQIVPADPSPAAEADYRVLAGPMELGSAWRQVAKDKRVYLSVELDDPSFPIPVHALLIQIDESDDYALVWRR